MQKANDAPMPGTVADAVALPVAGTVTGTAVPLRQAL